jgi:hypothetical protein
MFPTRGLLGLELRMELATATGGSGRHRMSDTTSNTTTTRAYAGWYRRTPRSRWRRVCAAATEGECWAALLKQAPEGGDRMVMRGHRSPWDDERRTR